MPRPAVSLQNRYERATLAEREGPVASDPRKRMERQAALSPLPCADDYLVSAGLLDLSLPPLAQSFEVLLFIQIYAIPALPA